MRHTAPLLVALALVACQGTPEPELSEEIPYDGVDQDGDGEDLVDVDGDGFAGVALGDYPGTWPAGLPTDLVDCDDTDPDVYPGSPLEVPYDGLDTDCGANDDYDVDGDGFVATFNPNTGLPHDPPYAGSLPSGDCNDLDAAVFPGADVVDEPYDGVDMDCDCADEFDVDGDGYMLRTEATEAAFQRYEAAYQCGLTARWGDCDDGAASVHPGAFDTWYDGEDTDCDGADDYDMDGDGYASALYADVYDGSLPVTDCADDLPDVHPDTLEWLGDDVDQDCNGNPDAGAFVTFDMEVEGLRRPNLVRDGNRTVLLWGADRSVQPVVPPLEVFTPVGLATFEGALGRLSQPTVTQFVLGVNAADPRGYGIDLASHPDHEGILGLATSLQRPAANGSDFTYFRLDTLVWNDVSRVYSNGSPALRAISTGAPVRDHEVVVAPDGSVFGIGCSEGGSSVAAMTRSAGYYSRAYAHDDELLPGVACTASLPGEDAYQAVVHVQPADGPLEQWDVTSTGMTEGVVDTAYAGQSFDLVNRDGELLTVYNAATGTTWVEGPGVLETLALSTAVRDAHTVDHNGTLVAALVTEDQDGDGLDDLVLTWGRDAWFERTTLDLGLFEPTGADLVVIDGRLMVAVTAMRPDTGVERVRWMVLGHTL
ncbi:MAG: hypothetical protein EP330_26180 [Deltaproteobacteria bacterium]|nr:MAG: hypothetical protein EP330_26180 [Deltaproteobacteria bacterium]